MILWQRGRVVSVGCGNQFRPVSCRTGSVLVLPSRTGLPVRCVKTRKRRNKVTTVGCSDWCGQLLCTGRETFSISSLIIHRLNDTTVEETSSKRTELFWRSDDPEVVLQPADHSSCDGHRTLQEKKNVAMNWKIRKDRKRVREYIQDAVPLVRNRQVCPGRVCTPQWSAGRDLTSQAAKQQTWEEEDEIWCVHDLQSDSNTDHHLYTL